MTVNKVRREELQKLSGQLDEIKGGIEALRDEEQDYYDNMPESLQGGEKGDAATTAIDNLQSAVDQIEEAMSAIDEATQ